GRPAERRSRHRGEHDPGRRAVRRRGRWRTRRQAWRRGPGHARRRQGARAVPVLGRAAPLSADRGATPRRRDRLESRFRRTPCGQGLPGSDGMPRAMWKGAISFGLVTIPVAGYPATEEKTLRFNQLHDDDLGRVRYKRVCEKDGEELSFEHIVKGYEYEKDHYVVLTDEDFDAVPLESSRAIDIVQFVHLDEIDPVMYKKSYYLLPEETGAKAYALLREALSQDNKVGVAKVSFRDKEHLAALRFRGDAFVLETMYWPDEIREADFGGVNVDAKVRSQELEMAR